MAHASIIFESEWIVAAADTFNVAMAIHSSIDTGGVEIGYIGEHFQEHLLRVVELATPASVIRRHRLARAVHDRRRGAAPGVLDQLGQLEHVSLSIGQFVRSLRDMPPDATQFAYVYGAPGTYFGLHAAWNQVFPGSARLGLYLESGDIDRPYPWASQAYVVSR